MENTYNKIGVKNNANNKEYILNAVKQNGSLLDFASDDIKNDKEVVLEAIKNNPESLEFASEKLKGDRDVVYESVSKVRMDILLCKREFARR